MYSCDLLRAEKYEVPQLHLSNSPLNMHPLEPMYYNHIWKVSLQQSCGNICQLWSWYWNGNQCFDNSEKLENIRTNLIHWINSTHDFPLIWQMLLGPHDQNTLWKNLRKPKLHTYNFCWTDHAIKMPSETSWNFPTLWVLTLGGLFTNMD